MTPQPADAMPAARYRLAGRLAIVSGAFGIAAFVCLIASLVMRSWNTAEETYTLLFRSHDVGILAQACCLIPFVMVLEASARRSAPGRSRVQVVSAVTFLVLVVLGVMLGITRVIADVLYMIPQGLVGLWLIAACRQTSNGLPRGLRLLGMVAGSGLALASVFPVGYFFFVDPAIFHGPLSDDDPAPAGTDRANTIVHLALAIGTLVGCSTYPVWSILAGRWLSARDRQDRHPLPG